MGPAKQQLKEWENSMETTTGAPGAQASVLSRLRKTNQQQRQRDGSFLLCLSPLALATRDRGNRSVKAASYSKAAAAD